MEQELWNMRLGLITNALQLYTYSSFDNVYSVPPPPREWLGNTGRESQTDTNELVSRYTYKFLSSAPRYLSPEGDGDGKDFSSVFQRAHKQTDRSPRVAPYSLPSTAEHQSIANGVSHRWPYFTTSCSCEKVGQYSGQL